MTAGASTQDEIERIRSEYARRARELPAGLYCWSRPANLFFHVSTLRDAIAALAREGVFPLAEREVADVGCGSGSWLLELLQWGAHPGRLHGIDLSEDRIREARGRLPTADLRVGDARHLPWPDASLDLITQFTMFTSVLDGRVKAEIAAAMWNALKPGGLILWYDFRVNNPRNRQVRGIGAREIRRLFPDASARLVSTTLAPPLARTLVPISWSLAGLAETVPFLRTHYLGVLRKPC